jgi:hypothetical protein
MTGGKLGWAGTALFATNLKAQTYPILLDPSVASATFRTVSGPEIKSEGPLTVLELDHEVVRKLRPAATQRGMTVAAIARRRDRRVGRCCA